QGDEPALNPSVISKVVARNQAFPDEVVCAMAKLSPDEDPASPNIPKVVTAEDGRLIYMSRLAVPGTKNGFHNGPYYKQVCVYAFNREQLDAFVSLNRKSRVEALEDIELLRTFDLNIPVRMLEVEGGSYTVDVPEDVPRVEAVLKKIYQLTPQPV
ncbi:MAG: 3-deoxy-manno-octulosonate cytidylyltransferase, partial [Calditrichaeota bacterium]|nr:3-deoxy-manno-octulosonate cytidylyltransferase [Calditrichota bacterium]